MDFLIYQDRNIVPKFPKLYEEKARSVYTLQMLTYSCSAKWTFLEIDAGNIDWLVKYVF